MKAFDFDRVKLHAPKKTRYDRQIKRMFDNKNEVEQIQATVIEASKNVNDGSCSFVIYGEPQSGKTEMMIGLTAKLLDEGHKFIVILLNDSVQLLSQNLERFQRSDLDPAPKSFTEVLDKSVDVRKGEWVIFCKKNSKDLSKLIEQCDSIAGKIVIDDEADFASPNSKVNKGEKTRINELIENLLGGDGIYIGVTATPARLDLNSTFMNENDKWVIFRPHSRYCGQDVFFPTEFGTHSTLSYNLYTLPDTGDLPAHLKRALFSFLINVSHLNVKINERETNYSMLIHTSGQTVDHSEDYKTVVKILSTLKTETSLSEKYYKEIWEMAEARFPGEGDDITHFIFSNVNRSSIIVMNSATDKKNVDFTSATDPATLFTFVIGGNIVSRGVTFNRLLSMFFTRDTKHKIQQDTYIQRARMFGSRGDYLKFFDLFIPEQLYIDWHKCFVFHRLSLASIKSGSGSPTWVEGERISAVSSASIDRGKVNVDKGEMNFSKFVYEQEIHERLANVQRSSEKIEILKTLLGDSLPTYLVEFIKNFSPLGDSSLAVHDPLDISGQTSGVDQDEVLREKGFIGDAQLQKSKFPHAIHHVFVIHSKTSGNARVYYKYTGNVRFLKRSEAINE